jgi:SAM-dependent methyltransferase
MDAVSPGASFSGQRSTYDRFCDRAYSRACAGLLPELQNSQYAYRDALRLALTSPAGRWLDLGCGHDFLPDWMPPEDRRLDLGGWNSVGIDLDRASLRRHGNLQLRVHGDVERLPFADECFNLVTANMVVEHVREPEFLFREIARVLAPGGTVVLHTPNVAGYTTVLARMIPASLVSRTAALLLGRKSEDVYPTFYRANSETALRLLAAKNALRVKTFGYVLSSPQTYRIAPLMLLEMVMLRFLRRTELEAYRPCLLVTFERC